MTRKKITKTTQTRKFSSKISPAKQRKLAQLSDNQQYGRGSLYFLIIALILSLGVWGYNYVEEWVNPPTYEGLYLHFIDVGQGDATLIQTPTATMLIDGGDTHMGTRVVSYLKRWGVSHIDYVIATHPHADHIGGLVPVLQQFSVGTVMMPNRAHTTQIFERFITALEQSDARVIEPVVGEVFSLGDAVFTVLAPNRGGYASLNDYSIVLHMVYGGLSALFTADAEVVSEQEMLANPYRLSADILQVGHHGSHTSTSPEFLVAVNPSVAVISAGAGNRYGHPHASVLDRLEAHGALIYRTDLDGHVVFRSDGRTLEHVSN